MEEPAVYQNRDPDKDFGVRDPKRLIRNCRDCRIGRASPPLYTEVSRPEMPVYGDEHQFATATPREPPKSANSVSTPSIVVVIPAYRAAAHIQSVLAGIPSFVSHIIVVDDCSPDNTTELVMKSSDPKVHLISHPQNQGVGGAVLTGYATAVGLGAEIVVKMDSDDQMDPDYLLPLIAPILLNEADYTKGNRFLHSRELGTMPLRRRIGNAGLSFLTKVASGYWNVFDPTNGYTAIHASLVPMLNKTALDRRFFFESSMLLELGLIGSVVRDVYIPARYGNEKSSLSEWKALFRFPLRLFSGFAQRLVIHYFLQDFGLFSIFLLASLLLIAFGVAFGGYHWYLSVLTGIPASTGTVMLAVLPIVLGSQLLLEAIVVDMQNVPASPLHLKLQMICKMCRQVLYI